MSKKILVLSLVVVMALSLVACDGEDLPSAEEIVDNSIQALDDVRSYEFEMDGGLEMVAEAEGESMDVTAELTFDGALDFDNEQMRIQIDMNMSTSAALPWENEVDLAMEAYLIDGIGYLMTDDPETGRVWEKEEVSEADWEEAIAMMDLSKIQAEVMDTAEVEVIGSERVSGVDCYVLQVTPDMEQLWETAMQQETPGLEEETELLELVEGMPIELFQDLSVTEWVAKDSYYLMQLEIDMTTELSAEAMGYPGEEGEMTLDATLTVLVYNYNQPISIELPPEAEEL